MSYELLQQIWFVLIAVLWIGYFVLEGFDFGVGILLRTLGKNEAERRALLTTLGPLWDGNEVWLLVAGGATFAAFPEWYATLFSGFYLPLFLILVALIIRGVAFEYRSKHGDPKWRARWDWALLIGSFLPALLWGVAFGNIVRGVEFAEKSVTGGFLYAGGLLPLLNPFGLLGGLVTLSLFTTHGAIFVSLKTDGDLRYRARDLAVKIGLVAAVLAVVFLLWAQLSYSNNTWTWAPVLLAAVCWLAAIAMVRAGREGWAFLLSALTLALAVIALFGMLFPNVMPGINGTEGLTIYNASSTETTLKIMTGVAAVMTPIVLAYQGWTYWVFRNRISASQIPNPEAGVLDGVH